MHHLSAVPPRSPAGSAVRASCLQNGGQAYRGSCSVYHHSEMPSNTVDDTGTYPEAILSSNFMIMIIISSQLGELHHVRLIEQK